VRRSTADNVLANRIENLDHGGYLLVEVPVVEVYGKGNHWHVGLRGIDLYVDSLAEKGELGAVKHEA
jgi:hypothetical protein